MLAQCIQYLLFMVAVAKPCIITQSVVDDRGQEHNVLPLVEWCCPVFQDLAKLASFGETKDITVPDIPLETDAGIDAHCTLASRMLDREDPCGQDHSWCLIPSCLPQCFLLC